MRNDSITNVVVRAPNWLGDAVMCEPAIRSLRRLFPKATLSLLAKAGVGDLFKGHPSVDHVILYEDRGRHRGLTGKWVLAGELRRKKYDLAVLFQNAFEAALLVFLAGIPRRYGYATDGRSVLLSEPVAVPQRRSLVHQVLYYWNLLRPLGLTGEPMQPELRVAPEEEEAMAARLTASGITAGDAVIGLNPGSTYGGAKRWLPERFAEAAERLCRQIEDKEGRRAAVAIFGATGEEQLGRDIAARLTAPCSVMSGQTGIRDLMAAIKRCSLLLTNDTGPMHIASALHVPLVAVFGPTDWRTTSPFGPDHAMVRHPVDCAPCLLRECPIDHRCMTGISVDQVYEAATKMLDGSFGSLSASSSIQINQTNETHQTNQTPILDGYTVFLDRDGTLNEDPGYLRSASELKLLAGVASGLARLKSAGAKLVVVTNQSGVGRGLFTLKDLESVNARLQGLLEEQGVALDAIYFCPHHPDDRCRCRKPARGMVDRAVAELAVDLQRSYVIGDHARDMQLARTVGSKAVLLTQEPVDEASRRALESQHAVPHAVVKSMAEAVEWILKDAGGERRKAEAI